MFTQIGLSNLWNELKAGRLLFGGDAQIVCDSETERCMKIYLNDENRYTYFSCKRSTSLVDKQFTIWIDSADWKS
jgi:hypothetical protein